jgi:hypothetical protein
MKIRTELQKSGHSIYTGWLFDTIQVVKGDFFCGTVPESCTVLQLIPSQSSEKKQL